MFRSNSANARLGLTLLLHPESEEYGDAVKNNFKGYKILTHNPLHYGEVTGKGFAIRENTEAFIGITGQYTQSTRGVRDLPFYKRQCLMEDEDLCKSFLKNFSYPVYMNILM